MEGILLERREKKKTISSLILEKEKLGSTIAGLEEEVTLLKTKLDNIIKYVCMLNNGADMLYEILEIREKKDTGVDYNSMNKKLKFP